MKNEKKILIIDDDPEVQSALKKVFKILGHKSFCANSGGSALQILSHHVKPSLIFCDLMMPFMNGLEFITKIRTDKNDELAAIPIVILSAEKNLANQVTPFHVEYLSKNFKTCELINLVQKYCEH